MLGIMAGGIIGLILAMTKLIAGGHMMISHGPLLIFAAVLIIAGVQLLALGLLGEMHVRHYFQAARHAPYSVERVLRSHNEQAIRE